MFKTYFLTCKKFGTSNTAFLEKSRKIMFAMYLPLCHLIGLYKACTNDFML